MSRQVFKQASAQPVSVGVRPPTEHRAAFTQSYHLIESLVYPECLSVRVAGGGEESGAGNLTVGKRISS